MRLSCIKGAMMLAQLIQPIKNQFIIYSYYSESCDTWGIVNTFSAHLLNKLSPSLLIYWSKKNGFSETVDVFTRKLLWGPRVCIQTGFINTTADFSLSASKYYTKVPLSKLSFPVGLIITHNSMIRGSLRDHNTCWLCLEQILVFSWKW